MIKTIREAISKAGFYSWVGAGAAVVILSFAIVAFVGSQKVTPNTGSDAAQLAVNSTSPSPSASASASGSATATAAASVAPSHGATPGPAANGLLVDHAASANNPTWQSRFFKAPKVWSLSYVWDCGGNGGKFDVLVSGDVLNYAPVYKKGDHGSGSVTVQGEGLTTLAVETTPDCSWHVTARG